MFLRAGITLFPELLWFHLEPNKSSPSNTRGTTGQGKWEKWYFQDCIKLKKTAPRKEKKKKKGRGREGGNERERKREGGRKKESIASTLSTKIFFKEQDQFYFDIKTSMYFWETHTVSRKNVHKSPKGNKFTMTTLFRIKEGGFS